MPCILNIFIPLLYFMSNPQPHSIPTQPYVLILLAHQAPLVLPIYSQVCGHPLEHARFYQGPHH